MYPSNGLRTFFQFLCCIDNKNLQLLSTIWSLLSSGRFSFYGPPTDIKVKNSIIKGDTRYIELKFSNLSQSTGAEIPRNCIVAAKIPEGTQNVVMLVSSASALRWKKGSEDMVRKTIDTFQVTAAPKSRLKIRAKPRAGEFTL